MRRVLGDRAAVRAVLMVAVVLALAAGCARPAGVSLTEKDQGRTIKLSRGEAFSVTLQSNPSTGYGWEVTGIRPQILRQTSAPRYRAVGPQLAGSGGVQEFRFKAVGAGISALTIVYRKPWEKKAAPARVFSVVFIAR
jgi:inhibitor of cysteine peptidase